MPSPFSTSSAVIVALLGLSLSGNVLADCNDPIWRPAQGYFWWGPASNLKGPVRRVKDGGLVWEFDRQGRMTAERSSIGSDRVYEYAAGAKYPHRDRTYERDGKVSETTEFTYDETHGAVVGVKVIAGGKAIRDERYALTAQGDEVTLRAKPGANGTPVSIYKQGRLIYRETDFGRSPLGYELKPGAVKKITCESQVLTDGRTRIVQYEEFPGYPKYPTKALIVDADGESRQRWYVSWDKKQAAQGLGDWIKRIPYLRTDRYGNATASRECRWDPTTDRTTCNGEHSYEYEYWK